MLLVFALTTAVGATYSAQPTEAKTVKAKKLKLKKKKLSIKVGAKKTLKVTVKPKKAKLTWKSSNKKVATVTKKGVVKGKKKGTAKITVTSGKKKATCKVTVKKAAKTYSISSVQVINSKVIRVTLNKAKKLSASDFAVAKRSTGNGTNYRTLSVASVNNSKNKVYDLILSADYDAYTDINYVADEDYVRVTIKKLNGTKVKEVLYYESTVPNNEYVSGVTGDLVNTNVYFNSSYKGYLTGVKITGLPSGLTAKAYGNYVKISGVPTAVANGKVATMSAKDELGKSLTQKIYFYIGSATQIVSYIESEGRTFLANDDRSEFFRINAVGGSGSYTYSLVNNTNKYISNSGSDIWFGSYQYNNNNVKQYLPAGKYNVSYTVTDSDNAKIKTNGSLAVTAVNGVKITGKVVAGDNTVITDAAVSAIFKDTNHTYYSSDLYAYTKTEDNTVDKTVKGYYYLTVYPSKAYQITAESGGAERGVVNYNPGTTNHTLNFALPVYKVTLNASGGFGLSNLNLQIRGTEQNVWTDFSNVIYLKKGTYVINDTWSGYIGTGFNEKYTTYKYTAKFTVNGNMTANITVTKISETPTHDIIGTLSVDAATGVLSGYYYFTPTEDGQYTFTTDDSQGVYIYDMDQNMIDSGYPYSEVPYTTTESLTKGTQYIIYFSDSSAVTATVYTPDSGEEDIPLEE